MSYASITEGLHEVLAAVTGIKLVLDYEPAGVQQTPMLYSVLDGVTRSVQGTHVRTTYRTLHRLCLSWQDPESAEELLRVLVDAIPEAVEASPRLGGHVRPGDAQINRGDAGWARIGDVVVRIVDFYSEVVELSGYRGLG